MKLGPSKPQRSPGDNVTPYMHHSVLAQMRGLGDAPLRPTIPSQLHVSGSLNHYIRVAEGEVLVECRYSIFNLLRGGRTPGVLQKLIEAFEVHQTASEGFFPVTKCMSRRGGNKQSSAVRLSVTVDLSEGREGR